MISRSLVIKMMIATISAVFLSQGCASLAKDPQFWSALGETIQKQSEADLRRNMITVIQYEQKRYQLTDTYGQHIGYATQQPEHKIIYVGQ